MEMISSNADCLNQAGENTDFTVEKQPYMKIK